MEVEVVVEGLEGEVMHVDEEGWPTVGEGTKVSVRLLCIGYSCVCLR